TPLERTQLEVTSIREQIAKLPGVSSVYTSVGGGVQEEVHKAELIVNLVPLAQRNYGQQDFKQYLRQSLVRSAGVQLNAQDFSPISGGGARPQPVQFNIRGDNWTEVIAAAEKTKAAMQKQPGFVDVELTYRSGKPQLSVDIDRDRAASVGVPAAILGTTLRTFLGGDAVIQYREGGDTFDVKVKLPPEVLADPEQVGALTVRSPAGQLVELRNLADIRPDEGPSQIDRQAQKRQITVLAELRNYSLGEALGFLGTFAKDELPPTVITDFEGQGKELAKAGLAFLMALVLGIILVYMILAAQFGSLLDPITIMMSLPFAIIGALGGLLLSGEYMSMFAMIGIIMLMGLVTKNGILLVDFTNQLKAQGRSTREALLEAGPIRLRPILMTTIAMIAGMVPVALARGDGAETRVPMAIAIIGGLVTSTVLTLGVVPVFYSLVDGLRRRMVKERPAEDLDAPSPLHQKADAA
ncbi:efflux RND transporter permease subunit, partial [Hyalangium sp.]|uniref:efflux RND transporter permease subunit n=1 Tax=Hyalangium sp. TaxID=2028555 RepID=UPI002D2B03EE